MKPAFYAIDESESSSTRIVSMTGVLIPFEQYHAVCGRIIRFVHGLLPGDAIHVCPPELHGASLLKGHDWATDEHRLGCFKMIVELVNSERLIVKRAGYFRHSVKELLVDDPKLVGLNFANLHWMTQKELEEFFVVSVFDGLDERIGRRLGGSGQGITTLVALGLGPMVSIRPPENLSEPLFATSRHSTIIQLADMVSYLLHSIELDPASKDLSEFKMQVRTIASSFDPDLVVNSIIEMNAV